MIVIVALALISSFVRLQLALAIFLYIQRLLQVGEARGFSGMLGSLDCMHWRWENCPVAWKGQYIQGDYKVPTIMLEAVASKDIWIWHAFFGATGSNNDITFWTSHHCSHSSYKAEHLLFSSMLTGHNTTWDIIWLTVSIRSGPHS